MDDVISPIRSLYLLRHIQHTMKKTEGEKIQELLSSIPKEHRANVKQLMKLKYRHGAEDALNIMTQLSEINADKVSEYYIVHSDDISGG